MEPLRPSARHERATRLSALQRQSAPWLILALLMAAAPETMGIKDESKSITNATKTASTMKVMAKLFNTPVVATDLDSIAARFTVLDTQVATMRDRVSSLQQAVMEVESLANVTGAGITASEQELANVSALSHKNAVTAAALRAQFLAAAALVKNATDQIEALQGTVASVQKSSLETGILSTNLGRKVGELELMIDDILPGKASIGSRIEKVEATLQDYQAQAQAGNLDPIVASKLRSSFLRATARTEALAEDALRVRLEAGS